MEAENIPVIAQRLQAVKAMRLASRKKPAVQIAATPHHFGAVKQTGEASYAIIVPHVSSENRSCLPVDVLPGNSAVSDSAFALYDAPLRNMALIASRLHRGWITVVCGKLKTDFRYSNTMGWNTFPVLPLTTQNRRDLTCCAENILLAREVHFPATIADLYDDHNMPDNLRHAHRQNDELIERIYIGRLFKNDSERLENCSRYIANKGKKPKKPASRRAKPHE